ncbi:hypothetical protein [Flexithrix dorotheae]|uniref:hypothetical protein n=1 Tax=Flexithrix dorotheae TaxID=70993 RepID=UPI000376A1D2|nr:hypothetical protein [Flexithrix dorotheae]
MNRKEFLLELWKKFMQPVVILLVLFFTVQFFYFAVSTNGTETQTIYLLTGIVLIVSFILLLRLLYSISTEWYKSLLSPKISHYLVTLSHKLNYLSPVALVVLLYIMWLQEAYIAFVIIAFYFIADVRKIILDKMKLSKE